jgi:DNA-directed RNA polymerase specialized sigma24 family protein
MEAELEPRPPGEWRRRFDEQLTNEVRISVAKFAIYEANRIRLSIDIDDLQDVVHSAIAGTLAGRLSWDPDRAPLAAHLCCVVRSKLSYIKKRQRKLRGRSLDDDGVTEAFEGQVSDALTPSRDREIVAAHLGRVLSRVRGQLHDDRDVFAIITAMLDGGGEHRRDLIGLTGLSPKAFDNAWRRLERDVETIPNDEYQAALAAMQ